MKLCLFLVAAVAVVTCYALPVPKEEVFAVYPVNSALAQHSSDLPVGSKSEQTETVAAGSAPKQLTDDVKPVETKQEEPKVAPEQAKVDPAVKEELAKENIPVGETKSAPLKESSDVKIEEAPVVVTINGGAKIEIIESEPKAAVPEAKAPEVKEVSQEQKSAPVEPKPVEKVEEPIVKMEAEVKSAPSAVEEKPANVPEVKAEPAATEKAEEKSAKITEEPKVAASSETTQARANTEDVPAVESKPEVKVDEKPAEEPAVKVTPVTEEKKPVVEEVKEAKDVPVPAVKSDVAEDAKQTPLDANVPEPKTEGVDAVKPTKVRAAPIVEGLKVSQPVEAEPAIAKVHVTVVQEDLPEKDSKAADKEVVKITVISETIESGTTLVPNDVEKSTTEAALAQEQIAQKVPEVKSAEPVEKSSETKPEVKVDQPEEVKSTEATVKSEATEVKVVEAKPDESAMRSAALESEPVVVIVPSVKPEEVIMIEMVESTDLPEMMEVVEVKAAPEVPTAVPETTATMKVEEIKEQPDKVVAGSSQPGATNGSDTVKDEAQDQSESISTTVSSSAELDTTTIVPVTEAEPVPTPAKQKAKKQAPPNLKGYSKRLKQQEAQRKQGNDNE